MVKRVTKDFETRSRSNLKKEGAYKYSLDPSTQPTCFAFKILGEPTVYFLPFHTINKQWRDLPEAFRKLWQRLIGEEYEFSAHNSFFEKCIYDNILVARLGWPKIAPRLRRCTAAKAAACALPRNLEGAGEALKLSIQKDKRGYVAMMATCKPTKAYNAWRKMQADIMIRQHAGKPLMPKQRKWLDIHGPKFEAPPVFLEPEAAPDVWETLYTYCKIDVRTEELLDISLPDLIPQEQEIWFLNQRLNWRGLRFDKPTVDKVVGIMGKESKKKLKELDHLTMGLITKPGARASILEFLESEGITLPNLQAKTVDDALKNFELTEDGKRLLEIRKALSMTSTKKYQTFLDRGVDDRIRDILLYHGASTGRDTGVGIQPHNFPRGLLAVNKNKPYEHAETVAEFDQEMLEILYGENLAVLFSAIIRNMIIPDAGKELFVADFSKIEVAVLWWLSDNVPGLKILRDGLDPYIYQAAVNTGRTYEDIETAVLKEEKWALDARQLGKAQILGCGFGMGWSKFVVTGWVQYRLKLSDDQGKFAVTSYRTANEAVPLMWKAYERAAIETVRTGKTIHQNKCIFSIEDRFLKVQLPSGRKLSYAYPQLSMRATEWGERETLEFWAPNSKTKKWGLERTWGGTLTENIVQAVARDLMMPAMVRLEKRGYEALLMVHDEGITQKPKNEGDVDSFVSILCEPPPWGRGLPLEAKGWKGPRYRK
jgi:DNA polymerase